MNPWLRSAILGLVQGLTEFLPVSSDGHLTLVESFLPGMRPSLTLNIFLHGATFLAIIVYFYKDIGFLIQGFVMSFVPMFRARSYQPILRDEWMSSAWLIFLASIPTGLVGLALRRPTETFFMTRPFAAAGEVFTGVWILAAYALLRWHQRRGRLRTTIHVWQALAVGLMQGIAVLPGVSRSGSTVGMGLMFGIHPQKMARFSFLMAVPALAAALLLEAPVLAQPGILSAAAALGFGIAFVTGLGAIHIFLRTINETWLWIYGVYCLLLGGAVLLSG